MRKNNNLGFTLIELLTIITILGIISLIAVPAVNKITREVESNIFKNNSSNIVKNAINTCETEKAERKKVTNLYTIVEGKLDKELDLNGFIPESGYILLDNDCEAAYAFYDKDYSISKNYTESDPLVSYISTAPAYGLKWQSNQVAGTDFLKDTYTRTLDASDIDDDSVKAQIGDTPVTNAFDELDIYKDILPYTDEFGNEFMLIPKFYISKTKEVTDTEIIWNYAVSKHKLDNTYYLPSNFVDEGVDNDEHIELPYVLVGKYEAGSNGLTGDEEKLVSKTGLMPRVNINIDEARNMATSYNEGGVNGYQQYDIHVHDLLTILFAIEFKTMNSQNIIKGYTGVDEMIKTGESDFVSSSSGTFSNARSYSFNYRGIENLWGNIWKLVDGVNIDQTKGNPVNIYTILNSRNYSSNNITEYSKKLSYYIDLNTNGYVKESGFDPKFPFVNFATKVNDEIANGVSDFFYGDSTNNYKILMAGGLWNSGYIAGLSSFSSHWISTTNYNFTGARLVKTPLQN